MNNVEQSDGFDLGLAAIPACSLDPSSARAQKERYRAIAQFITDVHEEASTVVVEFASDVDGNAVDEAIAVERRCCGTVFDFEFDRSNRSLRVTATHPADSPALELIAAGFGRRFVR
jgi:hypothetical protein